MVQYLQRIYFIYFIFWATNKDIKHKNTYSIIP